MVEGGYAAVTSRSVATAAGIHAGNVHYYFPTIDDLFGAVLERGAARSAERLAGALASPQPLKALWKLQTHGRGVGVLDELMAAAKHRKPLGEQVVAIAGNARRMQLEALRELLPQYGLDEALFTPDLVAAMLQGTSLLVAREEALGLTGGDRAAAQAAEALIDFLENRRDLNKSSN